MNLCLDEHNVMTCPLIILVLHHQTSLPPIAELERRCIGIKKMGVAHKESPNHANVSRVTAGIVGQLFLTSFRRKAQAGHPKNTIGMIYMPIMIE